MSLVSDIQVDVALRIHDVANAEVSAAQLITFVNMGVKDARNAGWLIYQEEDESLIEASTTYEFTVPAGFAYIWQLKRENTATGTFDYTLTKNEWRIAYDNATAKIVFYEPWYVPHAGANLKILGQARPTLYTAAGNTIDTGMDAFLRERATYYAASFVAGGRSEYAQHRYNVALLARVDSEKMLAQSPQMFRMKPDSRYVPGR